MGENREILGSWLSDYRLDASVKFCVHTAVDAEDIASWVRDFLIDRIDEAVENPYFQQNTCALLANAGVLPMFGFPTRSRDLYGGKPEGRKSLDDMVVSSRDLGMSITSFAPGSVTVKDGSQHLAVGFASYTHRFGKPPLRLLWQAKSRFDAARTAARSRPSRTWCRGPALSGGGTGGLLGVPARGIPNDVHDDRL